MQSPDEHIARLKELVAVLPESPGVYQYLDKNGTIIYVGKAKRLKRRVSSYFNKYQDRAKVRILVRNIADIKHIVVDTEQDALLLENNIPREMVSVLPVWFERLEKRNAERKRKIVFYGDMRRKENYLSIIWFVKHVWPLLNDVDVELDIAGNKPVKKVRDLASDRIHVLGFVDDIAKEFAEVSMLVAPWRLGAGIKVKVLEAMGCGLPVLTNHIGIEGIPAINGESYIHCETAEEYQKAIIRLLDHPEEARRIGVNAEKFIDEFYNMEQAVKMFADKILKLAKRNGD